MKEKFITFLIFVVAFIFCSAILGFAFYATIDVMRKMVTQ